MLTVLTAAVMAVASFAQTPVAIAGLFTAKAAAVTLSLRSFHKTKATSSPISTGEMAAIKKGQN